MFRLILVYLFTWPLFHDPSTSGVFRPINEHRLHSSHVSILSHQELLAHDVEDAWVATEAQLDLLVAVVDAQDLGPGGPRVAVGARRRWFGKDLERCNRLGALRRKGRINPQVNIPSDSIDRPV